MTDPRFNIPGALALLYGIARPVTFPGVREAAEKQNPAVTYSGIQIVPDQQRPMSYLGTPIFYPITFKGSEYKKYDKDGTVQKVQVGEFRLPLSCVVEMSRAKNITTTEVVATQASVKEVYSHEDWHVRISGLLLDEPQHPQGADTLEAMQERLLEFEQLADSVEILGDLFQQRQIYRLTIKNISFNQFPGKPRVHGFQMECDSDDPLELILQ